jgi:hypothetical protein
MKGYGNTPSHRKLAVGYRVLGDSGYMSGHSGHRGPETPVLEKLQMGNTYPETPGACPDTLDTGIRIFRTMNRTVLI